MKLPNRFIPINLGEAKYRTPVEEVPKPLVAAETLFHEGEKKTTETSSGVKEAAETKEDVLEGKNEPVSEI